MQNYIIMYRDAGATIFQTSQVNQPKQGDQPWQSNSLLQMDSLIAGALTIQTEEANAISLAPFGRSAWSNP